MTKHNHETTLNQIFAHPINLNLDWKKVQHLLESLGATVEETRHGRFKVELKGNTASFANPHGKDISSKDEVMEIRHFLEKCGVRPSGN